jgi:hypothetical protein
MHNKTDSDEMREDIEVAILRSQRGPRAIKLTHDPALDAVLTKVCQRRGETGEFIIYKGRDENGPWEIRMDHPWSGQVVDFMVELWQAELAKRAAAKLMGERRDEIARRQAEDADPDAMRLLWEGTGLLPPGCGE